MAHAASDARTPVLGPAYRSPWRVALDLWRSRGSFRGFCEFAVIGAVVLWFLSGGSPYGYDRLRHLIPFGTGGEAGNSLSGGSRPFLKPGLTPSSSLPTFKSVRNKRLAPRLSDVSFDSSYFDRVEESLRGKLVAAWKAYRARKGKQVALAVREIGLDNRYALLIRGLQTLTVAHPAATKAGIDMLERSAAAGEPRAMAVLGVLKVSGFPGFPRDTNGGRKLLEQASAAGDAAAARVLGMGYVTGWMGRVDPPLAEQYLRLSSDRGDARGTFQLASMYFTGHGVAKDDFEAERLYIKAAKAGYVEAQAMLGVRRLLHYGAGLTDDPSEALALLEKAAAKGQPNAMYYLGMFYVRYGKRIGRLDIKRGVDLFRRCAEATLNTECAFAYATALDKGLSVPRDPVRAYALYVLISSRPQPGKAPARRDELAKSMSYEDLARANVIAVQLAQNASKAHRKKTVK